MSDSLSFDKKDTKCPKCGLLFSMCQCDVCVDLHSETFRAFLSVESHGGKDDGVTVIEKLPASEPYLRTFLKRIAAECRTRGTFRIERGVGIVELFGDKRIKVREFFEKEQLRFVG